MKNAPLFRRVASSLLAILIVHTGWADDPTLLNSTEAEAAATEAEAAETTDFVIPEEGDASERSVVASGDGEEFALPYIGGDESGSEATPGDDEVFVLDDFVVSAADDRGYYSANSISATRTNALVKNTPISITVINEQLLEDLNILDDQGLVRATASVSQDPDGFSFNQLRIRGFRSLTQRYDLFWREIERDGYNIQRVDIVKGANSLIYGQADPGGQINSVPKVAQIGNNFVNMKATVGNNEYRRFEFDANYTVNDEFAVRAMGVDFTRELDQLYEFSDRRGGTIETTWRPTNKTQLRARVEYIELDQNLAPNMFVSANDRRFAPNSPQDDTLSGNPSYSLGTYRNEFIYSPDAVEFIPQEIIDDLVLNQDFANLVNGGDTNVTRDLLEQLYDSGIDQDDRYSVTGPDKYNRREGLITTADWTQQLTDDLQLKIAVNREDDDRNALARDGYSAGRVVSDTGGARPFEPYVETYWRKQEGRTVANALKSTLLWDLELDNDLPILGDSEHKILLGADWDQLLRDAKMYNQVQDIGALRDNDGNPGGIYFNNGDLNFERFYLSDGFGPNTPNIGFNGDNDNWALREKTEADIQTTSGWFALQSSFLDERLRTLVGLRYDHISTDFSLNGFRFGVAEGFINNPARLKPDGSQFTYEDVVVDINDANNTESKVSPTIGALFWITDDLAVFANYARSIQSPTGVELTPLGEIVPPVFGEGYEYGIRFDMFDGKLNGQINAFYIEKENDNIVNYDFRLIDVYPYEIYGASHPEIYFENPAGSGNYRLQNDVLPGKRVPGDVSRSEGLEVEFFYNPNQNLSFILSYAYTNLDALEINENVNERFAQVFGQAHHNLLLIGRYKFTDGPLRGLTVGANQSFRSPSTIGEWYIEDDGDAAGEGEWYEVEFDPEFVTDVFFNYETRIGKGRRAPRINLGLRINNIWDDTDLIQRNKSAFHRPGRQYLLSANMRF
jgi:outer membrane receptor protein involved in Fe transport